METSATSEKNKEDEEDWNEGQEENWKEVRNKANEKRGREDARGTIQEGQKSEVTKKL